MLKSRARCARSRLERTRNSTCVREEECRERTRADGPRLERQAKRGECAFITDKFWSYLSVPVPTPRVADIRRRKGLTPRVKDCSGSGYPGGGAQRHREPELKMSGGRKNQEGLIFVVWLCIQFFSRPHPVRKLNTAISGDFPNSFIEFPVFLCKLRLSEGTEAEDDRNSQ